MSSKPSGKGRKFPFPQDTCYRCGKGRHQKVQDCKALDVMCTGCGKKGHFEKVCLKGKHSTHSLEVPQASTSTAGAGAGEPLYFNDEGQPVYMYMVSVPHVNKHLIKFPIALDYYHTQGQEQNGKFHKFYWLLWLFHRVAQGRHRGWCKLDEQKNIRSTLWRGQKSTSTNTYQDGKLWKYCSESARDVPCISEVEGQGLQTIILCYRLWQIP